MALRAVCQRVVRGFNNVPTQRRMYHANASPSTHNRDISEIFSEMITSGPHPSMERINKFMNAVYFHQPRAVTLFNINYRTQTERSQIRGLRVGSNSRRGVPHKNVILVSGLPLQDPSLIGVNMYVAAMLSRMQPMVPFDVSFIPLAHPREYDNKWRRTMDKVTSSLSLSATSVAAAPVEEATQGIVPENISLELRECCRPIEAYVTRQNKYYVNVDVDISAHRSTMQYKDNSLAALGSKGKFRQFFSHPTPATPNFETPRIYGEDSLLAPMINNPTLVLELRSSQTLDDDQIVARGEEIIGMIKEL